MQRRMSGGLLAATLAAAACSSGGSTEAKTSLTTDAEKSSYAIGLDIGGSLHNIREEVDLPSLIQGLSDTLSGRKILLSTEDARATLQKFAEVMQSKQAEARLEAAEVNRAEGAAFLAENRGKSGVIATRSGLQYEVIKKGSGPMPKATDRVTVHYRGTLVDDTEFDSSEQRGPATFAVNGVIPGWTEALQLMPVGSKYRLYIPSDLAYGENGRGPIIGPNATLIFDVELLAIQ